MRSGLCFSYRGTLSVAGMTQKTLWLVPAVAVGALTLVTLGIGGWELYCGKNIEAASWVMAAGGLGLIVFASVQLHRESQREDRRQASEAQHQAERLAAARAKLKPAAWLARRMCEQGVIESDGKGSSGGSMQRWLARWYTSPKARMMEVGGSPARIDVLQELMRETVTLAAEASETEVSAADQAFNAFIVAANIMNELNATVTGAVEQTAIQDAMLRARQAAQHLATAAHALERLAPRGTEEPAVPANPKFSDER
jgi:hypothetical protein